MVLNKGMPQTSAPGRGKPRPGDSAQKRWRVGMVGVLMVFAFPAFVFSLGTFALLQSLRIRMFDEIARALRPRALADASPSQLTEYASWYSNSVGKHGDNPVQLWGDVMRLPWERPEFIFRTLVIGLGFALVSALVIGAVLMLVTVRSPRVPLQLSLRERSRVALRAMWLASPWSAVIGMTVAIGAWYIGFDRVGGSRSLLDALAPTWVQAAWMLGVWTTLSYVCSLAFLGVSVQATGIEVTAERTVCRRCRYALVGLQSERCPECGADIPKIETTLSVSAWRTHRRLLAIAAAVLLIAAAVLTAAARASLTREWTLMHAPYPLLFHAGHILSEGAPLRVEGRFGTVILSAHQLNIKKPGSSDMWELEWVFEPVPKSPLVQQRGRCQVPGLKSGAASHKIIVEELPPGRIGFMQISGHGRLYVFTPTILFVPSGQDCLIPETPTPPSGAQTPGG